MMTLCLLFIGYAACHMVEGFARDVRARRSDARARMALIGSIRPEDAMQADIIKDYLQRQCYRRILGHRPDCL
jgi:hypothetical protein